MSAYRVEKRRLYIGHHHCWPRRDRLGRRSDYHLLPWHRRPAASAKTNTRSAPKPGRVSSRPAQPRALGDLV